MIQTTNLKNLPQDDVSHTHADISLGIFSTIALILLLWGFCWLKNFGSLSPPQNINVIFSEIAGLNNNAGVFVDGVKVGMVQKIDWRAEHQVLVQLRISLPNIVIRKGSKYEILTNGIVGAKYIQIDMPEEEKGVEPPPPVQDTEIVLGEKPVRPELAVNKLAITLSSIDTVKLQRNFEADRLRLVRAADQLAILANKSMPLVDKTLPLVDELTGLSKDMRVTSKKIAAIMNDPNFSSDLKETAQRAKETAQSIQATMHELNSTLSDKSIRADLLNSFQQMNQSTLHISKSLDSLTKVSEDKDLRTDLKQILAEAHSTLDKVDEIVSKPVGSDLKNTLHETRETMTHINTLAEQLNQILSKRSPLLHLMFGRPGRIESKQNKSSNK